MLRHIVLNPGRAQMVGCCHSPSPLGERLSTCALPSKGFLDTGATLASHTIFTECDRPCDQGKIDQIVVPVDPRVVVWTRSGPRVFFPSMEWCSYLSPLCVSDQAVAVYIYICWRSDSRAGDFRDGVAPPGLLSSPTLTPFDPWLIKKYSNPSGTHDMGFLAYF
jgi:hypothetical protein